MAAGKGASAGGKGQKKMLTLSEVSRRTKISMPTLQRYKKEYQERIPSEGEGRNQRYPTDSLKVFRAIKKENLAKRGRPRNQAVKASSTATPVAKSPKASTKKAKVAAGKKAPAKRKAPAAKKAPTTKKVAAGKKKKAEEFEPGSVVSLLQISKVTGIEYTKLQRLTKKYLDDIPTLGSGRTRKYYAEAIEVYKRLEAEGASRVRVATTGVKKTTRRVKRKVRRATKAKLEAVGLGEAALQKKVEALEEVNADLRKDMVALQREMKSLVKNLKKSIRITVLK